MKEGGSRGERVGQYFHWHLRRQVAFDIWWLVSGFSFFPVFLLNPLPSGVGNFLCLHHRTGKIMDDENAPWFNLFRISKSSFRPPYLS
jgi:hypothetical protein